MDEGGLGSFALSDVGSVEPWLRWLSPVMESAGYKLWLCGGRTRGLGSNGTETGLTGSRLRTLLRDNMLQDITCLTPITAILVIRGVEGKTEF
jgi:hypothetical protein